MVYKKLLELQKKGLTLSKNAENPFFKSKYLNLEKILEVYLPILSEMEIVVLHQTKDNKVITTILDLEDETRIESEFNLLGNDPQKLGSCITYAKRYNLGQLLNIVTDEDDDGNKAVEGTKKKQFGQKERDKLQKETDKKSYLGELKKSYEFSDERVAKIKEII